MQNRLLVGNLAEDVAITTLQNLFEPHGFITDILFIASAKARKPHRFALMATRAAARVAPEALNVTELQGFNHCRGRAQRRKPSD